ncbi:hypothetical protein [Streptomyces sp. NPDC047042]|uniref:hypothetical protein n=1 Tax=Streptomyces sp. NPDC047042 TaxID=3154807 RepID=UPI003403495F
MGDDASVSFDFSNYELRWPTELFVTEGERILRVTGSSWEEQAKWLLTEALAGGAALDFEETPAHRDPADDPWATTTGRWRSVPCVEDRCDWFEELVKRASELRYGVVPRPYWPLRHGSGVSPGSRTVQDAQQEFARLIGDFAENGYLVESFGQYCVDDHADLPDASEVIEGRLGTPGLWPLAPQTWDVDTFYGLTEVFHYLASRPRRRHPHSFDNCGWHYSEFDNRPARILYRWRANRLLREAGIEYELAAEGEDLGRLVAVTDDARSELVHRALHDSPPDITAGVHHAIALFRGRGTSAESKRSAIFNLARVLEERRALIKEHLGKDEGALFEIANRFDLRHRRADQRGDYDEAFLDWIFWWYLATVELTNELTASRGLPAET